ncbi:dihydroorotase [Marinospirillum alkaliphilum]|uniref:Dihydroorotase n=1 Tax=Marinospirillum alkaliphilum DSM 21637 TaxID=1122209 RepID=A0A1K1WQU4_9GAMM|nr:dihydroorotase [Marinospirillum alkaliphilum]SFX39141.1 dihydroorotase [Marinospirillum alkaliphilum DSM 21637]
MRLSILGGRVIDPAQHLDEVLDLHVEEGRILALGKAPAGFHAEQTLQAEGLLVCPGFIDLSCHLREPGPSYKGNIVSETRAALAGGFTSVCARPDTQPPLDSAAVLRVVREKAQTAGQARVLPLGALTQNLEGQLLANMAALQGAGCVAVTNVRRPVQDNLILRRCLEYAATFDLLVIFYPEDPSLAAGGCAHEGALASQLGLTGIPETAETLAVSRDLLLIEQTGIRAHFSHLSTARAVELVREAQLRGLPVTADVALSHLLFTDATLEAFDSNYQVQPPLRSEADRMGLLRGLKEGVLTAVSSGHLPHEKAAKMAPFAAAEPGMSSLEVVVPQLLQLVADGWFGLDVLVDRLALGPAELLGLESGALLPGYAADITLIDPEASWQLDEQSCCSAGHNTPFWQQPLKGRVVATLVDGDVRYTTREQQNH